jgi:N,N'-diacetyllegionaminate synthase
MKAKIMAEVGWNHMGDMGLAKKMIQAAAENGADIVKFQTWSEKNLKAGSWDGDGRRQIYQKAELTEDNHRFLQEVCEENNVEFLTSLFNINDLGFLSTLNLNSIKIPSHEVYNTDLIQKCSDIFDTVFISTGAAKWAEVESIVKNCDPKKLVLMHCVSSYPCPAEKVNLPRLDSLKKLAPTIGYSGHFFGIDDAVAAITRGVPYIEKHFTIDRELPGRDNQFAILPEQLKVLAVFRDNYTLMNIDKGLDLQECEVDTYNNYRGRWSKNA